MGLVAPAEKDVTQRVRRIEIEVEVAKVDHSLHFHVEVPDGRFIVRPGPIGRPLIFGPTTPKAPPERRALAPLNVRKADEVPGVVPDDVPFRRMAVSIF